jgi:hypothetical protein
MTELSKLSVYSSLLPILISLFFYKKIKEISIWVVVLYCLYSFVNDEIIDHKLKHDQNVSIYLYYFTLFEYLAFGGILYTFIKKSAIKKVLIFATIIFSFFCLYMINFGKLKVFDSLQTSIECIIIILFCLYFLFEQLANPQEEFIYTSYKFWITITLLIYLSGAFFLFTYAADLPYEERQDYWSILFICNIIKNILFSMAIYISTRLRKDNEPYESQF